MSDTPTEPKFHEVYPWCRVDDIDCILRSFVFEQIMILDIKDKRQETRDWVEYLKTGSFPQKLKAVT